MMIKIYMKWLEECLKIKRDDLDFEIYSHENIREREADVVKYWGTVVGLPSIKFKKIYYKTDKKKKYNKSQKKNYYGLLRINVLKSTDLNRKIFGWIEGVCIHCGVV